MPRQVHLYRAPARAAPQAPSSPLDCAPREDKAPPVSSPAGSQPRPAPGTRDEHWPRAPTASAADSFEARMGRLSAPGPRWALHGAPRVQAGEQHVPAQLTERRRFRERVTCPRSRSPLWVERGLHSLLCWEAHQTPALLQQTTAPQAAAHSVTRSTRGSREEPFLPPQPRLASRGASSPLLLSAPASPAGLGLWAPSPSPLDTSRSGPPSPL